MILWSVLNWLAISASIVAAYFVLKIVILRKTPTNPWFLIFAGLIIRSVLLINAVQRILTAHEKLFTTCMTSLLWMIGFAWLFNLIYSRS